MKALADNESTILKELRMVNQVKDGVAGEDGVVEL